MKRLLYFLLIIPFLTFSQDRVVGYAYQDPSLAFFIDDYGNTPFTLNTLVGFELQTTQGKFGYFSLGGNYEYADLYGGEYNRGTVQLSYTLNELRINNLEATIGVNWGVITRGKSNKAFHSGGFYGDLTYYIKESLGLSMVGQFVDRTDLDYLWNDDVVRFSFLVGVKVTIFRKQKRK